MNAQTTDIRQRLHEAETEKDFQAKIIQAAEYYHWMIFHDYDSRRSTPGFPDLVLLHPLGDIVIAELKTERGRVSPAQWRWLEAWRACGIEAQIWRPSMTDEIVARLRKPSGL